MASERAWRQLVPPHIEKPTPTLKPRSGNWERGWVDTVTAEIYELYRDYTCPMNGVNGFCGLTAGKIGGGFS